MAKARRKASARRQHKIREVYKEIERLQKENAKLKDSLKLSQEVTNAFKESESLYRSLVDTSPDAVTVTDLEGRVIYVSKQTLRLHDFYRADEVLGKSALQFIAPCDRERAVTNMKRTLKDGYIKDIEYTFLRKDGSEFFGGLNASLITDADGKPKGFIATTRDITERKKATTELAASEEKYRHVVEQAILGIIIAQGWPAHMVFANDAAARMFGYPAKKLMSLSGKKMWAQIHEHDRALLMQRFQDIMNGKPSVPRQIRIIRKDNTARWLEIFGRRIDYQGQPAVQVTAIDVTDRKAAEDALRDSEEKFSNLFHRSNDAIFLHDLEGTILDVNDRGSELFGYSRKEIRALKIPGLHPKEELKRSQAAFATIARDGFVNFEIMFKKKDGTIFPGEVSSSLFEIGGKKVIQGIVRDVTERKQAEREINRRLAMEEALAVISENLIKARDIDRAVRDTLYRLARVFRTERVCLFQKRGEQRVWDKTHEWHDPALTPLRWKFQGMTSTRYSYWLGKLKRDSAIIINDTKKLPAYARKNLRGVKVSSMLLVPLFFEDEFFGALGIFAEKKVQTWHDDDARILRAAGEIITASLVKDRYQKELTTVLDELQSQRMKLFELTQRSIDAQERERLYLASEIHDELLQGLVAVLYFLQMLDSGSFDARTREKRAVLAKIIKSSIDRARSLISEVEPIRDPDIGLIQAIKKSIKNRLAAMPIQVRFNYPKKLPRVVFAQKANVLRIIQEALTNVRKHSQATRLSLRITTRDDTLEINLKDNGIGFDVDRALKKTTGHFGLVSIQERALLAGGQLTITSAPGKGTRIHGVFPLVREGV